MPRKIFHIAKNVTDAEIEARMRAPLEILRRESVVWEPLSEEQPIRSARRNRRGKRTGERPQSKKKPTPKTQYTEEETEYLASVHAKPYLTITGRRDWLGLSTDQANRIKKVLLEKLVIEEVALNLGPKVGGSVKLLMLTEQGHTAVDKKPNWKRPKNVSAEHWWWQRRATEWYRALGHQAHIEMRLGNKRADVGVRIGDQTLALEIELSAGNAVRNIKADLGAGFDRVLIACCNNRVKKAIFDRMAKALTEEENKKTKLILLTDFSFVTEIIDGPMSGQSHDVVHKVPIVSLS